METGWKAMLGQRQKRHVPNNKDAEYFHSLIEQYQETDDAKLQEQLINRYKSLVHTLAAKFSHGNEPYEDLVQVGMIGLLASLHRFDASHGRHFEGFAVPTIVGEIKRYLRDKTWSVHVPRRIKEIGPRVKRAVEELTAEYQHSPKIADIAEHLGVSEEEVLETMEMTRSYHALSMDSAIEADSEGSTVTLLDLVGKLEAGYEQVDQKMVLEKALGVLNEREIEIINLTFFENLSQKQAGDYLGISQMHVSRLQRRALQKMKNAIHLEVSECI